MILGGSRNRASLYKKQADGAPSMPRTLAALTIVVAIVSTGCRSTGKPQFFGPGSSPYQQHQAQQFDPYPEPNVGPAVDGGRPEGYANPAPEPMRGHPNQWTAPRF